jgi:hypothetical protein
MLPDALPQLIERLLALPHFDAAQLRALIQHLPDPQASAEEMVRRGWITQNQFSSLFPDPQQRPTPQETMLVGFGDDESPPDADGEDWSLPISDEEDKADVPPEIGWAQVEAVPVLCGAAGTPQFESDVLVALGAGGNEVRRRESVTEKPLRQGMGWGSKGLLIGTLFLGSLFAGVFFGSLFAGVRFFGANSTVPPVARQESREANAGNPARAVVLPPVPPIVPVNNAKQPGDPLNNTGKKAQPAPPVAVPPPANAKPKPKASLYARVRQVVRENKTEETDRLGIGDVAYSDVPDNGSIMVGMEVTYAPYFTHNIIKSVRPIYQGPDGKRYDGPVCGNPTKVGERVVAKEGYAIGGAAIKPNAGIGVDGMQLTFMAIGADGLNPKKTYLSKWLGGYGGSGARTYVNDGRPIVGIAGMRSKNPTGPAFCLCLVTTQAGALADADGPSDKTARTDTAKQNDANQFRVGQAVSVEWGGRWWDARVLKAEKGRYYVTYSGWGSGSDEWVGPARIRRK